ncbi:MAG: S8 family peptidase [Streptosporangiaceae bacterium]
MTWQENLQHPKARHEAAIIVSKFAERNIAIGGAATDDGWIAHMHAQDQFLVREQYLGGVEGTQRPQNIPGASRQRGVLDVLQDHGVVPVEVTRVVRDIVLVRLNPDRRDSPQSNDATPEGNDGNAEGNDRPTGGNGETSEGEQRDVLSLLDRIEAEFGPRIAALDHVVTAAQNGHPSGCPATEPQEVYDPGSKPYPPVCPGKGGDGVRIYVADTGIVADTVANCPWLEGVTGEDDLSVAADGTILPYGGHGTFVAGVIRCLAPGADIRVENVFDIAGSALESDFVAKLNAGFRYGAEIFHVTVASRTKDNNPLMAFGAWMEHLHQHKGVVCVAPAGNSASRLPSWPAAFPGIISVGALATDWRSLAYFSDFGGQVDVYAPGQNLVNAFATGTYTCRVAPFEGEARTFSGMAQWSGTSFSTPIVTGLIAARMARCGESGQEAAAALLAQARAEAIPGVGPVLLPGCVDGDDEHGRHCGGGGGGCGGCGGRCDCRCGGGKHGPMPR